MTRFRAALLSGLAFGLGGVAAGGLRLMDSPSALLGTVGAAAVLGVAIVTDALKSRSDPRAHTEIAALRVEIEKLRDYMIAVEQALVSARIAADVAIRRTGSSPDLSGELGRADRTGPHRAL